MVSSNAFKTVLDKYDFRITSKDGPANIKICSEVLPEGKGTGVTPGPALGVTLRRGRSAMLDAHADTPRPRSSRAADRMRQHRLRRDLRVLAQFIALYCDSKHRGQAKARVVLKTHDVEAVFGKPLELCPACRKLLTHAFVKRSHCPLDPKPACKKCPTHCYAPNYRAQIREVMKYSGRRLVLRGRLDYLFRLVG